MTFDRPAVSEERGHGVGRSGRASAPPSSRGGDRASRPDPDDQTQSWQGDVSDGVRAWVGEPPSDPVADGPDADAESVARAILLHALTGQARSRRELRDRLAKKQVPDELAERLLDRFTEVGLVDDSAFARSWVESRQRSRGLARRALAQELRRKGVDDETARVALDDLDPEAERLAAVELVRRKARSLRGVDRAKATRRLVAMLGRKGYSPGLAYAVVRDELGELTDPGDGPLVD
jgi:regulatory protein